MADLKITDLPALTAAQLQATDPLALADVSASETKKITAKDLVQGAVSLIDDGSIPSAKVSVAIAAGSVGTTELADNAVTAAKLADSSSATLQTGLPASGDYIGQLALDDTNNKVSIWDGSAWVSLKAAGSVNSITGDTTGPVRLTASQTGDTVGLDVFLASATAARQVLIGPTNTTGAVQLRQLVGTDLPLATTTSIGAVQVNGSGLTMSGDQIVIDNSVTPTEGTAVYGVVEYDASGLVTSGRAITSADLPKASTGNPGAIQPGTQFSVAVNGTLSHTNSVATGTYTKVTVDGQGHVSAGTTLADTDIPDLPATKLTSGSINIARIADGSITGIKLADYATVKFGGAGSTAGIVTFPTAEYAGEFFWDELNEDLYLWSGTAWLPVTITSGELIFAGTYDASVNQVDSVTSAGTAVGLTVGASLPAAADTNNRYYLVVSTSGTGAGNAPAGALAPPDMILSNGTTWELIDVSGAVAGQTATNISFTPYGDISSTNVQLAIQELDDEKMGSALTDGYVFVGNASNVATGVAVTGDVTITNAGVTSIGTGVIVDADVNASAAITGTKIQAGTTSVRGTVQLTDSTSSTSTTTAATPNAVKTAYDLAAAALPKSGGTMTGAITFAAGQTISGYGLLDGAQIWTKGQRGQVTTLTSATTITPDFNDSNNFALQIAHNATLANPSNVVPGQSGCIFVAQTTGGNTLAFGSDWEFAGGTAPSLSTGAGETDVIAYTVLNATRIIATLISNVS